MNHTNFILIITIISFSGSLGVYYLIRKINQCTPTPQNVLTRRGDIELIDFNEPTQPLQTYYPREGFPHHTSDEPLQTYYPKEGFPHHTSDGLSCPPPSYVSNNDMINGDIPTYHRGSVPSYNTWHDHSHIPSNLTSDTSSNSLNLQPIPETIYINCPLENENMFNLLNYLIDNKYLTLSIISLTIITGFCIKSYFFTTPSSPPNSPPTFNLSLDQLKDIEKEAEDKISQISLEQLSEIIDKLNRGEILDEDIRDKLDQDFKLLVNDIRNSSGHHPLMDQPIYINSVLENENMFNLWIILFLIILFILISLFLIFLNRKLKFF